MKAKRMALINLASPFILPLCASAQQATTTILYVPNFRPETFSQPGAPADMLGIRVGMTVSQTKAIAEKSCHTKPDQVQKNRDPFDYRRLTVQSHPCVQFVIYDKPTSIGGDDGLTLHFSGPATGNRRYAMTRAITFNRNQIDAKNALIDPSISAIKASLLRKYGQPSYGPPPRSRPL